MSMAMAQSSSGGLVIRYVRISTSYYPNPITGYTLPQQHRCNVVYTLTPRAAWHWLRLVLDD